MYLRVDSHATYLQWTKHATIVVYFVYGEKKLEGFGFNTIEKSVDAADVTLDYIYNTHAYVYTGYPRNINKSSLSKAIKRLREKGLVEKDHKNTGEIVFKLTEAGQEVLLISRSEDDIAWDGKWRIVIFDIPDNKRAVRDILRNRLKVWGFVPWQKSVWGSKKNLTNKLRSLVKDLGIEDWVIVLESDNAGR